MGVEGFYDLDKTRDVEGFSVGFGGLGGEGGGEGGVVNHVTAVGAANVEVRGGDVEGVDDDGVVGLLRGAKRGGEAASEASQGKGFEGGTKLYSNSRQISPSSL